MGLMDRVKAQAAQIAQQAQEAAQEGRARLDQVQASRRGDVLLRQLGVAVFAERTGRGAADSQAKIDQLINDITAYERQNGLDLTNPTQQGFPPPGFPASGPGPFGGPQPGSAPGGGAGPFGNPQPGSAPGGGAGPFPSPASGSVPDSGGPSTSDPASTPAAGTGEAPSIDTTTSFFPAPGDDQPS